MVSKRIIPVVLLDSGAACKTIRFGERIYLGDPVNIAKIFSDIGVDEIIYLDITNGRHWAGHEPHPAYCTSMRHAVDLWWRHLDGRSGT